MTFPVSHKTVFVLDHGPHFATCCRQNMEFDIFTKTRQPGIIPLAPIAKSLWTCTVEAAMEYCRIVWDIYPSGKLIKFIVSDVSAQCLNSWSREEQNLTHLMSSFADVRAPSSNVRDCNILHGLTSAIEALCQCSEIQHEMRTSLTENAGKVMNRGRVICITSVMSDAELKSLEECFLESLIQHNKLASGSDSLMPVHHCELVMIHTYPINEENTITPVAKRELSPVFSSEIHSVKSGRNLASKLGCLVQQHYNLASTTVTGIPMKEEQNANSSANYDVELLHPAAAHSEVFKIEGVQISSAKDYIYETVTLKWCTPRSSSVELQYCISAFRITPVDVNSRPSSCLTNFLLNGRAVMLEMPRKSGTKVLSHMLSSHGGEIYIHTLGTGRSILEDPPSISEGCGGRVTDYRISDFGEFMKQNKLVPCKSIHLEGCEPPLEKGKHRLLRLTQYWPVVISHTTIFNMASQLSPLLSLVTKESISSDDVIECKKVIYNLVGMESKGASLPVPTIGTRGKGPKREEQYRLLWNELETFIRVNCITAEHRSVLECLLECRKPNTDNDSNSSGTIPKIPITSGATSLLTKKFCEKSFMKEEKSDFDSTRTIGEKFKSLDSESLEKEHLKLPSIKKMRTNADSLKPRSGGPQSLLSLWLNRINAEHAKHHVEFTGRAAAANSIAKLYPNLNTEVERETSQGNQKKSDDRSSKNITS